MTLFDGYVAVDWSASSVPKTGKDRIWLAIRGWSETEQPENPETRAKAVDRIETLLESASSGGAAVALWFRLSVRISGRDRADAHRPGWLGGGLVADRGRGSKTVGKTRTIALTLRRC